MVKDLWDLRLAAMREEGSEPTDLGLIARLQWETQGQLLNENFLVIMAYDGGEAVGYITLAQGDFTGLNAEHGFYVVGYYVRPEFRRGPASTRIGLAVHRVMEQMRIPRLQAIVQAHNPVVAAMLKRHGFAKVGEVYERRGRDVERIDRPEDGTAVHGQTGRDAHGGPRGHAIESAVPDGTAACDAESPEPVESVA